MTQKAEQVIMRHIAESEKKAIAVYEDGDWSKALRWNHHVGELKAILQEIKEQS